MTHQFEEQQAVPNAIVQRDNPQPNATGETGSAKAAQRS
jgi:hypothetical protein